MDNKKVLVTGIGGNVGQGIIRNIRALHFPITILGTNTAGFSAGNHLCDQFYQVPYAFDPDYISSIIAIVNKEKIDLIIPSTDYEVYYLSKHQAELPCVVAVSAVETAEIYLDKYKTFLHHQRWGIPFAASMLPANFRGEYPEFIVKPREGRGSRGLHLNPKSLTGFSDDFMVQSLYKGREITTAFYVNKNKQLHGFINLERELENGATNECRVDQSHNQQLEAILLKMISHANFRGSANLQSIVTANGDIIPFEVNCRISGTNSIRSNFGFEDVKYTLEEFLYQIPLSTPKIIPGVAVRVLMDVIYLHQTDKDLLKDNSVPSYLF